MNLLGIENSKIIFLTQVNRPSGQLYFPDAIAAVVDRYSFVKAPSPDQALPYVFNTGKFQNSQITEFSIYNDGFIVSSASDSDFLDAFIHDLLPWAIKEFDLVEVGQTEKYYESTLIVQCTVDLAAFVRPPPAEDMFRDALRSAGIEQAMKSSGFIYDFDPAEIKGKRKPVRFLIDRRLGFQFSQNTFFCQAPFRTKDHLRLLDALEARIAAKE